MGTIDLFLNLIFISYFLSQKVQQNEKIVWLNKLLTGSPSNEPKLQN